MNPDRIRRLEDGLSGVARKVLDAVPISEAWTVHAIAGEMRRATGSSYEHRLVVGCLESLKSSGLVREYSRGKFIRVRAKEESNVLDMPKIIKAVESVDQKASKPKPGISEMLGTLSASLLESAGMVDDIIKEFQAERAKHESEIAKLRQLQELLKGIAS